MTRRHPTVFIGASKEGLPFARDVQEELSHDAKVVVWNQGIFKLSSVALDDLAKVLRQSDFGIFLLTPDDASVIRGRELRVARDNVIFELGMFIAGLGRDRVFFICPPNPKLHIPSDLIGITPAIFDFDEPSSNSLAALGPTCNKIRRQIQELGPRPGADVPSKSGLHEGRVPVSKTVQLLQTAKSKVSVTGFSLRSFAGYFERMASHNFRQPIISLLKRGVQFDFNVLAPNCKFAILYSKEHGTEPIEEIRTALRLLKAFTAESAAAAKQICIRTYTRPPFAYALLVDPDTSHGSGLVAPYLPMSTKADSPYIEIYRQEHPVAFQKYADAVKTLTSSKRRERVPHP